jgi:hypothetical protein
VRNSALGSPAVFGVGVRLDVAEVPVVHLRRLDEPGDDGPAVDVPTERLDALAGPVAEEPGPDLLQRPGRRVLLTEHLRSVVRRVPGGHRLGVGGVESADLHQIGFCISTQRSTSR